jgi:phage tail sheath protein FI
MAEPVAPQMQSTQPYPTVSIEAAGIGTTAILGVADHGPFGLHPREFVSQCDFEAAFGRQTPSSASDSGLLAAGLWQAVRGFFENGGRRLRVARLPVSHNAGDAVEQSALLDVLAQLESVNEIALLCAPGVRLVQGHERLCESLLQHCDARRDRMALLDAPRDATLASARALRDRLQSRYGALYYPWVMTPVAAEQEGSGADSAGSETARVPASAHIAGIFADHDGEPGTHKSPASMPIVGAIALGRPIDDDVYDLLGPIGINVLRVLPGRPGVWLWGGRTLSDDDWNYVAVRRYLIYLERSIARGLRSLALEPRGEALWDRVAASVAQFLHREWRSGALIGAAPEEAYSVRCDRSSMTPAEIRAGCVVVMLGVALIEPGEFVLLRIELGA